jgi:hypothetical protein
MDEVSRFPTLSPSNEKEREIAKSQQRPEEIFALPCLRMDLKTKHVQGEQKPIKDDPKPVVDCTFVTGTISLILIAAPKAMIPTQPYELVVYFKIMFYVFLKGVWAPFKRLWRLFGVQRLSKYQTSPIFKWSLCVLK